MKLFSKRDRAGHHVDPGFERSSGTHYLHVIDRIEATLEPDLYLEIGSRSGASVSRRRCSYIAIDPKFDISAPVFTGAEQMLFFQQTSDAFFASGFLEASRLVPDLAFIDGMHLFEFSLRDFINCERHMTGSGVICLHDVVPFNHDMTTRDTDYLDGSGKPWTGDVWKTMAVLKTFRPDLTVELVSAGKTGLGVVSNLSPENTVLVDAMDRILDDFTPMTLETFGARRYLDLLDLKEPEALTLFRT